MFTAYETLTLMIYFSIFVLTLVGVVIALTKRDRKK